MQQIQQSTTFTMAFLACRLKANTVSNAVLNLDLLQQQIYRTSKPTYNTELPYALQSWHFNHIWKKHKYDIVNMGIGMYAHSR